MTTTTSTTSMMRRIHRAAAALTTALFAISLCIGAVSASTPVTDGYRDHTYGGGVFRPTFDKTQSKLWYTDGTWFAGMFLYRGTTPIKSEYHIWRLDKATHSWVDTGTLIDARDQSHGDYYWDEPTQRLYVASAHNGNNGSNDSTLVYKYTYDAATGTYTLVPGFPVTVPDTVGGTRTATITRELQGARRFFMVWTSGTQVMHSVSTDAALTWSAPTQVPAQAANPIEAAGDDTAGDTASVIAFGSSVGIAWSDRDSVPATADDGYYFARLDSGADPTIAGNWTTTKLPTLLGSAGGSADNHINLKTTSDGRVYMVGKTDKATAQCATAKNQPLIEFFERTQAGTWSVHLVGTVGDCNTRPQVVISEELDTAFVVSTSPIGGGAIYMKSAPLTGPEAFKFRAPADDTVQRGVPIIRSTTDTAVDDPTTSKQPVSAATDLVVLANNLTNRAGTNLKYYLHAEVTLPAVDTTAPAGTVSVDGGASWTASATVSVAVPATDAGTGVSQVRLSNSPTTTAGVLATGQTYAYRSPISFTLGGGDGTRTVYAQWRDSVGNWSAVSADSIGLDTTAPTGGSVTIQGGDGATATRNVTLSLAASDGAGVGVAQARISNTADYANSTLVPFAASVPWTLPTGDGSKTVYVKFVDALGNESGAADASITLDQTGPTPGSVQIDGGAATTGTTSTTIAISGSAGDATQARAANRADMVGATSVPLSGSTAWTLATGADGLRTVYVQWRDALGNWSAAATDAIYLDTVPPTGGLAINGGKPWTNTTAATLTFPNTETDVTLVRVGSSSNLSGVAYQAYTPGMSLPFTLGAGSGLKTVYAQFKDVGNHESGVVSDTISIETAKPTAPGIPSHRLRGAASTGIPVGLTWSAGADTGGSGVGSYVVQQSVNGGPFTTVVTTTARSAYVQLAYGKSYVFRVATRDNAGNLSTFRNGSRFTPLSISDKSTAIKYGKKWYTFSASTYMGTSAHASSVTSATATYTFSGKQIGWLSRTGPDQGIARVYINNNLVATVNLAATTQKDKQLVFSKAYSTTATRTIKIVVVGGKRVTLDQLFVIR